MGYCQNDLPLWFVCVIKQSSWSTYICCECECKNFFIDPNNIWCLQKWIFATVLKTMYHKRWWFFCWHTYIRYLISGRIPKVGPLAMLFYPPWRNQTIILNFCKRINNPSQTYINKKSRRAGVLFCNWWWVSCFFSSWVYTGGFGWWWWWWNILLFTAKWCGGAWLDMVKYEIYLFYLWFILFLEILLNYITLFMLWLVSQ